MKKLVFVLLLLIFIGACDKEQAATENILTNLKAKTGKINICHKGKVISVNINAVPAHQKHGDAVDLDGDGLFDIDCDDEQGIGELLLGTWTTEEVINVVTSVGTQSIAEYLIGIGFSPGDAAAQQELIESALANEVTGTLELYGDNTYVSYFAGGSDSGIWELSADETTLTLFEGPVPDIIVITINSITANTWNATTGGDLLLDLDGNPATPDVLVTAEASVIFIK